MANITRFDPFPSWPSVARNSFLTQKCQITKFKKNPNLRSGALSFSEGKWAFRRFRAFALSRSEKKERLIAG